MTRDLCEQASRKAHVEAIAKQARAIIEGSSALQVLTVHFRQGLPGRLEVVTRLDSARPCLATDRERLARELRQILLAAERVEAWDVNGCIRVSVLDGTICSELQSGPREDWRVASLEVDTQPAIAAH